jgi:hypothetical protein
MINTTNITKIDKLSLSINNNSFMMIVRLGVIIISIVNIGVLANKKLKDSLHKYLLVMTIADLVYTTLISIMFFTVCHNNPHGKCGSQIDYFNLVIYIFVSEFLTSSLAIFNILLEIFLTLQRIVIISHINSRLRHASVYKVCLVLFSISLAFYSPMLAVHRIDIINKTTSKHEPVDYKLSRTNFGMTNLSIGMKTVMNIIRIILVTLVLSILNGIVLIKYKAFLVNKKNLKRPQSNFVKTSIF